MMSGQLAEKRCLIVGGTGGIGRAAAARFLVEGARVVVAGRSEDEGARAMATLQGHGPVLHVTLDATVSDQVNALFGTVRDFLGGLDVLYHVAGISGRRCGDGALHECTEEGWEITLAANLKSTFLTNQAAVRHFREQRQAGVILNLASVLAFDPSPRYFDTCAYAASKGGIVALSRLAAARYAADGIRVNVLAPGLVDTPMSARAVADPAIRAFLRSKQPLSEGPGQADDLGGAAVFLCSDAARWITGVVLPVDGGWSVSEGERPA
jgi:NAD(P)-dependent dehydrogenase (short-subunit alcohol dehydrogenase family)